MLTTNALKIVGTFFGIFFTGMVFGNAQFLYLSAIPLSVLAIGMLFDNPEAIALKRNEVRVSAWINDTAELSGTVEVGRGVGVVTIVDPLPAHFDLVHGSNFLAIWKGFGKRSVRFSYTVKCTRRGVYRIGPSRFESRHVLGLRQTTMGQSENIIELVVRQKPWVTRKIRDSRTISNVPMPPDSVAKFGAVTTDFREIRSYSFGDPYKHVNWKATSRVPLTRGKLPLVNQFELEGRKVVWIFIDGSTNMGVGTTVENAFEYALQVLHGLAQFYLARNCFVGVYIYNDGGKMLLPESGRKQMFRLTREILGLEISATKDPLKVAVEKCRGHMLGTHALNFVVTMVTESNAPELIEGVRELRKYTLGRRRAQTFILNLRSYRLAATGLNENLGATLLDIENQSAVRALRGAGAYVVSWDPKSQGLSKLILLGMRR
jgi:uncharacterized protein (DUF58 family)